MDSSASLPHIYAEAREGKPPLQHGNNWLCRRHAGCNIPLPQAVKSWKTRYAYAHRSHRPRHLRKPGRELVSVAERRTQKAGRRDLRPFLTHKRKLKTGGLG